MSLLCLSAEDDDGAKAMPHASPAPVKQTIDTSNVKCATCGGNTTYKTGTNKDGKKWAGYFCANKEHAPKWGKVEEPKIPDITIDEVEAEPMPF